MSSNQPALPSPPPWAQQFSADDLDQVTEFVSRFADQHSRVAHHTGTLGFRQSWVVGASLMAGWLRSAIGMTVRGTVREPVLHLAVPAGSEYRFGRRRLAPGSHTVTFVPPGWAYTLRTRPGAAFAVAVRQQMLAQEVEAREPGRRGDLLLRARSFELDGAGFARIASAAADFAAATAHGASRPTLAHSEARFVGVLSEVLLDQAAAARGLEVAASRLADLESWIEAHLEERISLGRLCTVAGVGERALQKAFESRRGMSPMRYVAERRLGAARRLLTCADASDDVTHVAVRLGFGHVGRFAAQYRQAFGESPSESLRRALR